jgi:hypothetical protein
MTQALYAHMNNKRKKKKAVLGFLKTIPSSGWQWGNAYKVLREKCFQFRYTAE